MHCTKEILPQPFPFNTWKTWIKKKKIQEQRMTKRKKEKKDQRPNVSEYIWICLCYFSYLCRVRLKFNAATTGVGLQFVLTRFFCAWHEQSSPNWKNGMLKYDSVFLFTLCINIWLSNRKEERFTALHFVALAKCQKVTCVWSNCACELCIRKARLLSQFFY